MSRRRDPPPSKNANPLTSTSLGSLYGEAIGVKPGIVLGPPILSPKNLVHKRTAPVGFRLNPQKKSFSVEVKQSGPGGDALALDVRKPVGFPEIAGRGLLRLSVMGLRYAEDRMTVLEVLKAKVLPSIAEVRADYEEAEPPVVSVQNCGSGWMSQSHFFLIGKEDVVPRTVNLSGAGMAVFGVASGVEFTLNEKSWTWKMDTEVAANAQRERLTIMLVEPDAAAAAASSSGSAMTIDP